MDQFKTPSTRSTTTKRDSLAAELERDPHLSSSKRIHRTLLPSSSSSLHRQLPTSSLERQLLTTQTAKIDLETKLREKELLVERLERERAYFADREEEVGGMLEEERRGWEEEKRTLTTESRTLRTTLSSLRDQLADLQDTHTTHSHRTHSTINTLKSQLATLEGQNTLLASQISESKALAEMRQQALDTLQTNYEDLLHKTDNAHRADEDAHTGDIIKMEMEKQIKYLPGLEAKMRKMEAELRLLRGRERSVEVMREEKRDLERRVVGVEEMRRGVEEGRRKEEEMRRRVGELEGERDMWMNRALGGADQGNQHESPSSTPIPVSITLSSLRQSHASLLDTHGSTLATLHATQSQLAEVKAVNADLRKEVRALREKVEGLEGESGRVRRVLGVSEREVAFLKALVASYDAEQNISSRSHPQSQSRMSVDDNEDQGHESDEQCHKRLMERIEHLEGLLEEYKWMNEELRRELGRGGGAGDLEEGEDVKPVINKERIEELEKEVEKLRKEREQLKEELSTTLTTLDTTEQSLFELQGEIGAGRHVPPHTRILSMKDNPEEEWFKSRGEVIRGLKSENEALVRKLREIEEGGGVSDLNLNFNANTTHTHTSTSNPNPSNPNPSNPNPSNPTPPPTLIPPESYASLLTDLSTLQTLLTQKEKRLQRLQTIFQSKSAEFRDAITSILGVKLAFYPNGGVRVTSVFDLYASFVFQPCVSNSNSNSTSNSNSNSNSTSTSTSNSNSTSTSNSNSTSNTTTTGVDKGTDGEDLRTMQLIAQGEGGPEDVGSMMEYWIGKEQCIPGFMASVTLECWEKRRREGGR